MRERNVEAYLRRRVKSLGGEIRKVKWIGRANAPDDRVMLPERRRQSGILIRPARAFWVECKAPDANMNTPHVRAQLREHARMRARGETVLILDTLDAVNRALE